MIICRYQMSVLFIINEDIKIKSVSVNVNFTNCSNNRTAYLEQQHYGQEGRKCFI